MLVFQAVVHEFEAVEQSLVANKFGLSIKKSLRARLNEIVEVELFERIHEHDFSLGFRRNIRFNKPINV